MRFHVLGLPHTSINESYVCCAYSMKLRKWAFMMAPRGHEVILYSNEGADVPCENVQIFSEKERQKWFGEHDPQKLYHLLWDPSVDYWRLFNERCIEALLPRVKKGDFILTCAGNVSQPVGNAFPGSYFGIQQTAALVEAFIGYYGTFSRYKVYESHAHREWCMGAAGHKVEDNQTAVVENYWDLKDFVVDKTPETVKQATKGKPYYLFIGRVIPDKGWGIAVDATRDIGARLIMAGQGDPGEIRDSDHVTFFGAANVAERAALMAGAIATFCPTHFREPFGGTAVETQLCGTPAITTDHGAFTQTVEERWRCANQREFAAAARRAEVLAPGERLAIKLDAERKYSLEAIAPKFERYFQRLIDLWADGWYQKTPYKLSPEENDSKCQKPKRKPANHKSQTKIAATSTKSSGKKRRKR
jgi:glycosyltransferase involved in cell wall biosynthesis